MRGGTVANLNNLTSEGNINPMLGDNLKRSNTRGTRKHEFKELIVDAVPSDRLDLNSQLATPLKRHKNDYLGGSSPVNIPLD